MEVVSGGKQLSRAIRQGDTGLPAQGVARRPLILVLAGPPCSGKSWAGARLAEQTGLVHLEMDAFRVRLFPDGNHSREERVVAYRAMHYAAEKLVEAGLAVAVNACYGHRADRADVAAVALRCNCPLYVAQFRVSIQQALQRWERRRGEHPGADLTAERVRELVRGYPYYERALMIDGETPVDETTWTLIEYLMREPAVDALEWAERGED